MFVETMDRVASGWTRDGATRLLAPRREMRARLDLQSARAGLIALLRAGYALTPAEAAAAVLVSEGLCVKEAARVRGIAPSTLRTHLNRVFGKTGIARQSALAALVTRLAMANEGVADDPLRRREPLYVSKFAR